jgi:enoyl-[acyl-carrier protein] reductase II
LRRAVIEGDVEAGSLMAGQSVGMVTREQSTADILAELVGQALALNAVRELRSGKPPPLAGTADGPGAAEGQDPGG